ncbi:hypothetical protein [Brevundimonas sp.]|uniref:hypothetical protein n=1 Tax=Brevundimonas sp. TaxID=1871086 RepID=UPI0028A28E9A|nr:hypothetical protein [Brevundimonas sp.]
MSNLYNTEILNVLEFVTLDFSATGGAEYNFVNTINPETGGEAIPGSSKITYLGREFISYPFETGGYTRGSINTDDVKPGITFADFDFVMGAILEANNDGMGAEVTRHLALLEQVRDGLPPMQTDRYMITSWSGIEGVNLEIELSTLVDYNPEGEFPGIVIDRVGYPGVGSAIQR